MDVAKFLATLCSSLSETSEDSLRWSCGLELAKRYRSPFHKSCGVTGKPMTDRQETSARLMPEKNDHPIEGATEDVAVHSEYLFNALMYGRDALRSFSKVNPMVDTIALEASSFCVGVRLPLTTESPKLFSRADDGDSFDASSPSAFPVHRTVMMLSSSFVTLNDRGSMLHDDLEESNRFFVMRWNIFSLLSMSWVVRADSCRIDA